MTSVRVTRWARTEWEETSRLTTLGSLVSLFIGGRTVAGVGVALGDKHRDFHFLPKQGKTPFAFFGSGSSGISVISSINWRRSEYYISEIVESTTFVVIIKEARKGYITHK